uniref:Uncharacterized protein n=1 Tax=uncultured bacterium A1Q1_fos_1815 TaxID=1256553 RepID=L7VV75_9BACT|nr:hypothetical protein [uncultured bacterium A1Q1_fos_1815]
MCLLNRFFVITDTACPIFDLGVRALKDAGVKANRHLGEET